MLKKMKTIDLIVKTCAQVKAGQQILIVADDYAASTKISQQIAEACNSLDAEVVMTIMAPRQYNGQEPPKSVAEAMQLCDILFSVFGGPPIAHTNAAHALREKGIKSILVNVSRGEDYFDREISVTDLNKIKERTEHIADTLSRSNEARVTSSLGTDLKMSLKGRKGLSLHPLGGAAITTVPDYAEAAISPVEGSTEGILVTEGGVRTWESAPTQPVRVTVRKGKATEVSGPQEYVERFKRMLATDENASNCAAELGIGTTHTMPKNLMSSGVVLGTIHIAVGRNNDIGGQTYSKIHSDLMIYKPTLWLDNLCIIKDGEWQTD